MPPGFVQHQPLLEQVDARLDNGYKILKIGRLALGDAPISFASTAVSAGLHLAAGPNPSKPTSQAISHAGLAADGLFRGLFYVGGLMHGAAAKRVPWLVVPRTPPAGLAGIASKLSTVTHYARLGLLGIGGVLGAIRAAKAVHQAGGNTEALIRTKDGRAGVLQAAGSVLLMVRHPATYLLGAGLFAVAIANEFT